MLILHTADNHLGYRAFDRMGEKYNLREEDVYLAWDAMIRKAKELKPQLVLVAGDIFDSPTPPMAAIKEAQRLWELNCEVLVVMGNHERTRVGEMCPIELLKRGKTHVFTEPATYTDDVGNTVFCAPDTGKQYKFAPATILCAHGQMQGPEEYMHQTKHLDFDPSMYRYCALGDLHRYWNRGNIYYCGCLTKLTFHQEHIKCGFLVVELRGKVDFYEAPSRQFITVDSEEDCKDKSFSDTIVRVTGELSNETLESIRSQALSVKIIRKKLVEADEKTKGITRNSLAGPKGSTLLEEYVNYSMDEGKNHLVEPGLGVLKEGGV